MGLKPETILQISPCFEGVQIQIWTRAASLHYSSTTQRTNPSAWLWPACEISHPGTAQGMECLQWHRGSQRSQQNSISSKRPELLITRQVLKGLPRKHRHIFNSFYAVGYQAVWIWGNFPQFQHTSGIARRRFDLKLFTGIYFWAMQKRRGPIIILFRPN